MELEGGEGSATDMAGDAGVVGRWLVQHSGGAQPQLQLDLKGVLYNATLVRPPAWLVAGCSAQPPWQAGCEKQQGALACSDINQVCTWNSCAHSPLREDARRSACTAGYAA